jgi:hypothetical protein
MFQDLFSTMKNSNYNTHHNKLKKVKIYLQMFRNRKKVTKLIYGKYLFLLFSLQINLRQY